MAITSAAASVCVDAGGMWGVKKQKTQSARTHARITSIGSRNPPSSFMVVGPTSLIPASDMGILRIGSKCDEILVNLFVEAPDFLSSFSNLHRYVFNLFFTDRGSHRVHSAVYRRGRPM